MQIIWFTLSLLTLEVCYQTCQGFSISNIQKLFKNQNDQQVKMVKTQQEVYYYYEEWFCGEVDWEFAGENSMNSYALVVPEKIYLTETDAETDSETYTKECKKPLAIKNGIVKVLYHDFVKVENFAYQMQNIDYSHYLSEASLSEELSLMIIGLMSYFYKNGVKNELNILRKQKKDITHKKLTLQEIDEYLRFQKLVKTFMIVFLFIFTKNVKNAE
jgi:hypothetical protein